MQYSRSKVIKEKDRIKSITVKKLKDLSSVVVFGYGKIQQQTTKKPSNETSLLYYKVGKDGVITNYQAWLRGWREHKITKFDVIFQEGLRELKRKWLDLEAELQGLEYQPMVTILKEFWVPTRMQLRELEAETNDA